MAVSESPALIEEESEEELQSDAEADAHAMYLHIAEDGMDMRRWSLHGGFSAVD